MSRKKRTKKKYSPHKKNSNQPNKKKTQEAKRSAPVQFTKSDIRRISVKMVLFGLIGMIGIIAAVLIFYKLQHPIYEENTGEFRKWGMLLFLTLFFGVKCSVVL